MRQLRIICIVRDEYLWKSLFEDRSDRSSGGLRSVMEEAIEMLLGNKVVGALNITHMAEEMLFRKRLCS